MRDDSELLSWIIAWLAVVVFTILVRFRKKMAGSGLVLTYFFQLGVLYLTGAFIYSLPWYDFKWNALWNSGFTYRWIEDGFKLATLSTIAFAVGDLLIAIFVPSKIFRSKKKIAYLPDARLPKACTLFGAVCYFALTPLIGRLPTVSALISSGLNLMVAGISLSLWNAWQEGNRKKFYKWLIASLIGLPFFTIAGQGFLSFGSMAAASILLFVAGFFRPRWKLFVFSIVLCYIGLSLFVTYMRDRREIRNVVWSNSSITARLGQLHETVSTTEWFNLYNQKHLEKIDSRLNQNMLVGAAVGKLSNSGEFVKGETILTAFAALVPRVVWPNKPIHTGGSGLVSKFTDLKFAEDTSVGIGQVMEFYANFGETGVIVGFFILGILITFFDAISSARLLEGNWRQFIFWFLPGLAIIQSSSSLVEVVTSTAGAFVMAGLTNYLLRKFRGKSFHKERVPEVR